MRFFNLLGDRKMTSGHSNQLKADVSYCRVNSFGKGEPTKILSKKDYCQQNKILYKCWKSCKTEFINHYVANLTMQILRQQQDILYSKIRFLY